MTSTQTKAIQPTHRLYSVIGEGKSARWIDLGAAWPNKDGQGFSMQLHALPLTSRLVMREITEKAADDGQPV